MLGDRGPVVRQVQGALQRLALRLSAPELDPGYADGIWGERTERAARQYARLRGLTGDIVPALLHEADPQPTPPPMPAPRRVPVCAWTSRYGVLEPTAWVDDAQSLGLARVGLFLNPLDKTSFAPFASAARCRDGATVYQHGGIGVDLTAWVRPSRSYLTALVEYVGPLLRNDVSLRLDLDTESAWKRGLLHRSHARWLWRALHQRYGVTPDRVSVNDYASLQPVTRTLIEEGDAYGREIGTPGPRRRLQCYSVGHVTHGDVGADGKRWTESGDVYYPGVTQEHGVRAWRPVLGGGAVMDIGIAAYKPVRGLTPAQQVEMQASAALRHRPSELWLWQLQMGAPYRVAVRALTAGEA